MKFVIVLIPLLLEGNPTDHQKTFINDLTGKERFAYFKMPEHLDSAKMKKYFIMKTTLPVIFIALLFTACDWMKPDIYASGLRTKRFVTKGFHLNPNDTIGILPPMVTLKKRILLEPRRPSKNELRNDGEKQVSQAKIYYANAVDRYLTGAVKYKRVQLSEEKEQLFYDNVDLMFKVFEKDSVANYPIEDEFVNILKSTGYRKFFITKVYWEYYSEDLYIEASFSRYPSSSLNNPTIMISCNAIIDLDKKSVTIYDSNCLTPANCAPVGYWCDGRPKDFNPKYPDQNKVVNRQVRQIVKRFVRKGK